MIVPDDIQIISRSQAKVAGLKYYYTGKPCKHGHTSKRITNDKHCFECREIYQKIFKPIAYSDNHEFAERSRIRAKQWNKDNREKHRANKRKSDIKLKEINREKNKKRRREYVKKRKLSDISFKIKEKVRKRIYQILKGNKKTLTTCQYIGCTSQEFVIHIERQFTKKMTWDTYGAYWHLDHIIPCASFDFSKEEDCKVCFHFTNMRPLEWRLNIEKSNKRALLL